MLSFFIALYAGLSLSVWADVSSYPTGWLQSYSIQTASGPTEPFETAASTFLKEHFPNMPAGFEWRAVRTLTDATHIHRRYVLYYQGTTVLDRSLDLHYNRLGFVQYASSLWEGPVQMPRWEEDPQRKQRWITQWKAPYIHRYGQFKGIVDAAPVYWIPPDSTNAVPAYEVKFTHFTPFVSRYFVAEQTTGRVLMERPTARSASVTGSKAWLVSPYHSGTNDKALDTIDLEDLTTTSMLKSSYLNVQRLEDYISPTLTDIDPDPAVADYDPDPDNYDQGCTGTGTQCPNQRMDAINVYYHLSTYRSRVQKNFDDLGVTPSPTAAKEPLNVIINNFGYYVGTQNDATNNAAYLNTPCFDTSQGQIERCLIFLRPAHVTSDICGKDKKLYDLAREAVVVVHEYTHFVTDIVTGMLPSATTTYNVGDALHEGYSDYFGASEVSRVAGQDVTLVGEYAFQNCTYYDRDVGTLRVYQNSAADKDPHFGGLSWASGLWQLRKDLGVDTADLLARKSQFFLSQKPGFWIASKPSFKQTKH